MQGLAPGHARPRRVLHPRAGRPGARCYRELPGWHRRPGPQGRFPGAALTRRPQRRPQLAIGPRGPSGDLRPDVPCWAHQLREHRPGLRLPYEPPVRPLEMSTWICISFHLRGLGPVLFGMQGAQLGRDTRLSPDLCLLRRVVQYRPAVRGWHRPLQELRGSVPGEASLFRIPSDSRGPLHQKLWRGRRGNGNAWLMSCNASRRPFRTEPRPFLWLPDSWTARMRWCWPPKRWKPRQGRWWRWRSRQLAPASRPATLVSAPLSRSCSAVPPAPTALFPLVPCLIAVGAVRLMCMDGAEPVAHYEAEPLEFPENPRWASAPVCVHVSAHQQSPRIGLGCPSKRAWRAVLASTCRSSEAPSCRCFCRSVCWGR